MQAACPDGHQQASGHCDGKSDSLADGNAALLCLSLHLVRVSPVSASEINNVAVLDLTLVQDNVSIFIIFLCLQVVDEVADSLFVGFLVR